MSYGVDFQHITISGNERTKEQTILRELVLEANIEYAEKEFETKRIWSERRVMNINLFNAVDIHLSSDSSTLEIEVVEKWYFWPIPFVEFSDRNFNVWSDLNFDPERTNYGLYLFNYNLWGRDHTLKTSIVNGYNKIYALEYQVPFLGPNTNWGLHTDIRYRSQAEMWLKTESDQLKFYRDSNDLNAPLIQKLSAYGELSNRFRPYTTLYLDALVSRTQLDSTIPEIAPDYLMSSDELKTFALGASVINDQRNNVYFPTEGSLLGASFAYHRFSTHSQTHNIRFMASAQHFKKIGDRLYTSLAIIADLNTAKVMPYEYTRRLGYSYNVRGFERRVIDGNNSYLANASIRYHLINKDRLPVNFVPFKNYKFLPLNVYLGTFADAGYVDNQDLKPTNELPNTLLYSTGLSLQALFYNDRVLRIEYSLNSLKEGGFFVHFKKAI